MTRGETCGLFFLSILQNVLDLALFFPYYIILRLDTILLCHRYRVFRMWRDIYVEPFLSALTMGVKFFGWVWEKK